MVRSSRSGGYGPSSLQPAPGFRRRAPAIRKAKPRTGFSLLLFKKEQENKAFFLKKEAKTFAGLGLELAGTRGGTQSLARLGLVWR
jgi:hypothetical protein